MEILLRCIHTSHYQNLARITFKPFLIPLVLLALFIPNNNNNKLKTPKFLVTKIPHPYLTINANV